MSADLSAMSKAEELFVTDVIQQAKITIDEEGAEASAITEAVTNKLSVPNFYQFNRPFLYFIVRKSDQLILFSGQFTGQ